MLGPQKMASLQETGIIEVAPLAFMRGRTLNDAFIILDEAQNTTREQMKMFLTRLGFGSRAAITGDITQIDLPAQVRTARRVPVCTCPACPQRRQRRCFPAFHFRRRGTPPSGRTNSTGL